MGRKGSTGKLSANVNQVMRNARTRKTSFRVKGNVGNEMTNLRYKCLSPALTTDAPGFRSINRHYIGGNDAEVLSCAGVNVLRNYSTYKLVPGTRARWVPSVGFTTSGRVIVGYLTSPEQMVYFDTLTENQKIEYVRGMGNSLSFPVYEDREWDVPTVMRRKMFDVNASVVFSSVDVLDRSCQVEMVAVIAGTTGLTDVGYFEYTDHMIVEGLTSAPSAT